MGKMEEVTQKQGRTILFVSHNLEAIKQLCQKCILLEKGKIVAVGETTKVINKYLSDFELSNVEIEPENKDPNFFVRKISFKNKNSIPWTVKYGENINLEIILENKSDIQNFRFGMSISEISGKKITTINDNGRYLKVGVWIINIIIKNILNPGPYELSLGVLNLFHLHSFATISVLEIKNSDAKNPPNFDNGLVTFEAEFKIEKDNSTN
jgi:lipopolysaccharide transport system ATP-binding protein